MARKRSSVTAQGIAVAGCLSGFVASLFLSVLFLSSPIRALALAAVLGLAAIVTLRRGARPLQGGYLFVNWFSLGYALFSALLAALDLVFPPVT